CRASPGIAGNPQHQLVLLRSHPTPPRRILAEAQKLPQRITEMRHRANFLLGMRLFLFRSAFRAHSGFGGRSKVHGELISCCDSFIISHYELISNPQNSRLSPPFPDEWPTAHSGKRRPLRPFLPCRIYNLDRVISIHSVNWIAEGHKEEYGRAGSD